MSTQQTLSLPKGGGSVGGLGGSFAPDLNTGGGGYSLPIDVPDGVNGHTPSVTLQYAAGHADGPLGLCWSIGGVRIDVDTATGSPRHDGTDTLVLPGAGPILPAPDDPDRFVAETDGLLWDIRRSGVGFQIVEPSGRRHRVGTNPAARIADPDDPDRIVGWMVEETTDATGESIAYTYLADGGNRYPETIAWANYLLRFSYEARPDVVLDGRPGWLAATTLRCSRIELEVVSEAQPIVRRWELGYVETEHGGHSRLSSVTTVGVAADGSEVALPAVTFGYSAPRPEERSLRGVDGAVADSLLAGATFADLTGDGLPDVVDLRAGRMVLHRNRGDLLFDRPRAIDGRGVPGFAAADAFAADVAGRGRVDLVSASGGLAYRFPIQADASVGRAVVSATVPALSPADPSVRVGDLDGDRAIDLVAVESGVLTLDRHDNGAWSTTRRRVDDEPDLADIETADARLVLASMKGDGLTDLVQIRSGEVRWWPAIGETRWAPSRVFDDSPVLPVGYRADRLLLTDTTGDGLADLVYVDDDAVRVWSNVSGHRFGDEQVIPFVPGATAQRVASADLDGSGVAGLVLIGRRRGRATAWYLSFRELGGHLLDRIDGGLGDRIDIEYRSSSVDAVADLRNGTPWSTSLPLAVPVVKAVTRRRHRFETPHTTRYRYHDGAWDTALRRFLGFGRVEALDAPDESSDGVRTVSEFHTGRPGERIDAPPGPDERIAAQVLRGRLIRSTVHPWNGDLGVVDDSILLAVEQDWVAHLLDVDGMRSARPRLVARRELHHDGVPAPWRSTTTTNTAWDAWEQVTAMEQRDELAADPAAAQVVHTTTSYAASAASPVRDKPARILQTDAAGTVLSLRIVRYDGADNGLPEGEVDAGRVSSEERLVLRDDQVTAAYGATQPNFVDLGYQQRADMPGGWFIWAARYGRSGLDGVGVPTLTSTGPRGHEQTIEFDASRLAPIRITDARGNAISATYDRRSARVTTITEPNGAVRTSEYDALGRIVGELRPGDPVDDPSERHRPVPEAPVPFTEQTAAHETGGGSDVVRRRLFDSVGNLLVSSTLDDDGSWVIDEAYEYNWRGQVARTYRPHRTPVGTEPAVVDSAMPHTLHRYDALGRMVGLDHPDGSTRSGVHEPGRSTLLDEEDTVVGGPHEATPTVYEFDGSNRVRSVVSTRAGVPIVTRYSYDIRDSPTAIVDPSNRTTAILYDLEGRRIRVDDPDAGTTTFVLDPAGNLVERRNGLGERVLQEFDELQRLRRTSHPDTGEADVVYEYLDQVDAASPDAAGRIGRLHRVIDSLGTTTLTYDDSGEMTDKHIERPDGTTFELGRRLDRLGRLAALVYPATGAVAAPPEVSYEYNSRGLFSSISTVIDSVSYNDAGQAEVVEHANGVTTTRTYDGRGRAESSVVTDAAGAVLDDWTLDVDAVGNVRSIASSEVERTWSYGYDDLYQLTRAELGNGTILEYSYDDAGNIVFRSDVGDFLYGEGGAPAGCVTTAGGVAHGYDTIGRQTSGPDGTIAYDPMQRVTSITNATTTVAQSYGGFGAPTVRRTTTAAGTGTVIHLDGTAEIRNGAMVCFVVDGDRPIAQFVPGQPVEHLHQDHRGSTTLITGNNGNVRQRLVYDPFGMIRVEATVPGHVDSGRRGDRYEQLAGIGAQLVAGRLYGPRLGRFATADPVISDLWHPIALNRYAYVANNPVTVSDPSGRAWWHVVLAAIAVVAVVVLTVVTFGAGIIGLGAMIGVFAAMAAGAAVGGIAAAKAGGGLEEILLGIFVGAALAGAAALGGALIGVGFGAAFGTTSFLTHVLGGAASGLLLGAATGFAAGFAGGMGSAGGIWEKTWKSALIGAAIGIVAGVLGYGLQEGWFGESAGLFKESDKTLAENLQEGAAGTARDIGEAANAGTLDAASAASSVATNGASVASKYVNWATVLEVLVTNPVAANLHAMLPAALFSLDVLDDLIDLLREEEVDASFGGEL